MSTTPHLSERGRRPAGPGPAASSSPAAVRLTSSRWRDPRLWLGVLLVLASVTVGARLLAAADDTAAVWQLERDIGGGLPVTVDDLTPTRVHFDDAATAARYLPADEPLPAGSLLARSVTTGELLTRSSLTSAASDRLDELPVGVAVENLPADLAAGERVAVWAVPDPDARASVPTEVLDDALVLSVGSAGTAAGGAERAVLVELPAQTDVAGVLTALNGSDVVLVRTGE